MSVENINRIPRLYIIVLKTNNLLLYIFCVAELGK